MFTPNLIVVWFVSVCFWLSSRDMKEFLGLGGLFLSLISFPFVISFFDLYNQYYYIVRIFFVSLLLVYFFFLYKGEGGNRLFYLFILGIITILFESYELIYYLDYYHYDLTDDFYRAFNLTMIDLTALVLVIGRDKSKFETVVRFLFYTYMLFYIGT